MRNQIPQSGDSKAPGNGGCIAVEVLALRYKDAIGDKLYYFEGIPEKWVIVSLIR